MTRLDNVFDDYAFACLCDHFNPWMACDDFYLSLAQKAGGPVLDLGCGTGMLACRIAQDVQPVTGADPADGMLRVARARPGSERVTWTHCGGQDLNLKDRFKLAYMTGHAFQAVITDDEVIALLTTVRKHLAPSGHFAFETRNPAAHAWKAWVLATPGEVAEVPGYGQVEEAFDTTYDPATGIAEIRHVHRFLETGREQTGTSRIRWITPNHLDRLLTAAGLEVKTRYGDWDGSAFQADSREIISVVGVTE